MNNKNEVTIYHIARTLDVSPSTVSRALSDSGLVRKQTRDKIKKLASDLGYRPNFFASRLKTRRSRLIGVAVTQINTSGVASVVNGAEIATNQNGYNVILKQSMNNPKVRLSNFERLRTHSINGLLVVSSFLQESSCLKSINELDVPVIIIETSALISNLPKRQLSNFENTYQLTNFLVDMGCKRIAYLSEGVEKNAHDQMLHGYRQALADSNLREADKFVLISSDFERPWIELCRMLVSAEPFPDGVLLTHKSMTALLYSDPELSAPGFWLTSRKGTTAGKNKLLVDLGKIAASLLVSFSEQRISSHSFPYESPAAIPVATESTHI